MPPNVTRLLLGRELCGGRGSTQRQLNKWQETDFVAHSSASYCSFQPAPRSTIALSYNSTGKLLASTHGDHTVKVTSCDTGRLVKVLTGHRRTPWVVRFHPRKPSLLASGSLDHEVRLWDATSGQCIAHHTFGKPIASLAFHVSADVLAIACGHKLYIWEYTVPNKVPTIVLKTRRSMRAVHFHPHGQPVVLTAEVQDPSPTHDLTVSLSEAGPYSKLGGSSSSRGPSGAAAQQQQQQQQTPAAAARAPNQPPPSQEVPIPSAQLLRGASPSPSPSSLHPSVPLGHTGAAAPVGAPYDRHRRVYVSTAEGPVQVSHVELELASLAHQQQQQQQQHASQQAASGSGLAGARWRSPFGPVGSSRLGWGARAGQADGAAQQHQQHHHPLQQHGWGQQPPQTLVADLRGAPGPASPFQRWLANNGGSSPPAQQQERQPEEQPPAGRSSGWVPPGSADLPPSMVPLGWELPFPSNLREPFAPGAPDPLQHEAWQFQGPGNPASLPHVVAAFSAAAWNIIGEEQPPRVRLRLWRFDSTKPSAPLESEHNLKLQISDAVLCSEMGVHFSPCGRFVAATTACRAPLAQLSPAVAGAPLMLGGADGVGMPDCDALAAMLVDSASPRPERAVFEVRVYSIDRNSFGDVMMARRIRAAHCLTSVQFSPCCDHLLLAYGKKHISLLRSLVAERGVVVPMHTILEVFRLSDMELVRVLPSSEDEINAACFHPRPGGGIAYGTKEGKLRLVAHDRSKLGDEASGSGPPRSTTPEVGQSGGEWEGHPTERELQGLQQWVLTQQWLQQQASDFVAPRPGGGGGGAAGQQLAGVEVQALQLLRQAQQDAAARLQQQQQQQ